MPDRLPDHYDPNAVEQYAADHWNDRDAYPGVDEAPAATSPAYEYVTRARASEETFYFLDGPPFTSGRMHVGNAWGKVLKDCLLRYHRMNGRDVRARPGYDTHGLPVEVNVEQRHGFETKGAVEDYGVDRFTAECRAFVEDQRDAMTEEFRDLGVWMDWDDPYQTMDPEYVDVVWDAFTELHDMGLVERGKQVVNTCPRCETAVSDSRLEYEVRTAGAAYVGFSLADRAGTLLTWTTTPWTVVGNQFVAVDADAEYAAVSVSDGTGVDGPLYVAMDRVVEVLGALGYDDGEYTVHELVTGEALVGWTYHTPLADRMSDHPRPCGEVVAAEYVDTGSEGTGLVHSAPGFGHEDFERGRQLGLLAFGPVGLDGRFTEAAGQFAGKHVHEEGREAVLEALREAGALLGTERHDHEYPQCPRCDTDVVLRAAEQWLVRVTDHRSELVDAAEETTWYPAEARDGRFRNTIENAPDWNVSRQRYWGTPLPVWVCEDCGADVVVSSRADLAERSGMAEPLDDPHRPAVDEVTLSCPDCGGTATRVADVLDVWFDSAVASWASLGVRPSETPGPDAWPADLVVEGNDQTRGWFLMQLYLGVALAGRAPYEEVLMHGWALLDGEPMSKSRGHVLRPPDVVAEHGRDALRAHLLGHDQQAQDVSLTSDLQGVETVRDRLDVVWNVVRFATLFMREDDYDPRPELGGPGLGAGASDRPVLDRWVLARLRAVVETATTAFESREPDRALETVLGFLVADVSRFYVQTVRERVWTPDATSDKRHAYDALATVLHASVRMLAPFVPHLAERLYAALDGTTPTVHATDWPDADAPGLPQDPDLAARVATLRDVESAVGTARQRMGRKRRWPVAEVVVESTDPALRQAVAEHRDLVADRVNAASVHVTDDYDGTRRVLEPEMDVLGPSVRGAAEDVAATVSGRPATDLPLNVTVDGSEYEVTRDHVSVVERVPSTVTRVGFDGGTVYVDESLSEGLRREGLVRDVVRRAQEMRDDLDLGLDERVRLHVVSDDESVSAAVHNHADDVTEQVRVAELSVGDAPVDDGGEFARVREWTVDGALVELAMDPVDASASRR